VSGEWGRVELICRSTGDTQVTGVLVVVDKAQEV